MHAVSVLQKCLSNALDRMDKRRVRTLLGAVTALLVGRRLVLMELARHWPGAQRVFGPLKRIDRLLSNHHLHSERESLYAGMARWLIPADRPVILVDWSPLKADERWQLLRAAVTAGGRSMTLYESVHPRKHLANPKVERDFLRRLARMVPAESTPIVVTDAGFKTPWFKAIAALGWDYVGRVRGTTRVQLTPKSRWVPLRSLYSRATRRPRRHAQALITETRRWPCELVLYRRVRRGRVHRGCHGKRVLAAHSRKQAQREREPWLLATSLSSDRATNKQIIDLYSRRMQIEQSFRDLKSARFGAAFRYSLTRTAERLQILLLIHALSTFVAWLAGMSLNRRSRTALAGMNVARTRQHYSSLRLGFEALKRRQVGSVRRLWRLLQDLPSTALNQMNFIT